MEPTSEPCTCLNAALYWTNSLEQEAVYLKNIRSGGKYKKKDKVMCGILSVLNSRRLKLYNDSLIRCDTVFDVSLFKCLKGLYNSKQLCHVVIPLNKRRKKVLDLGELKGSRALSGDR